LQGWEIQGGGSEGGRLRIRVAVEGALLAVDRDGRGATLRAGGRSLRYEQLFAWDADGRDLDVWIEPDLDGLAVVVDDEEAEYPIVIDPLITPAATILQGNVEDLYAGGAVASAGDVDGDGYGDVVVGAWAYDNGQTNEGAAFIYMGSASGLATSPALTIEGNVDNIWLGYSLANGNDVNGDGFSDLLIPAVYYSAGQNSEGGAFLHLGSASGLQANAQMVIQSNVVQLYLGQSAAAAGDVNGDGYGDCVLGAPSWTNGQNSEGAGFVYHGSASGLQSAPAAIVESNAVTAYLGGSQGAAGAGDVNGDGSSVS
jgi:hypothetical protein